jgi:transcriptional regulator with XRE-family HTH domain
MFAIRLKELRKGKDMSQAEAAYALGISQSTWALYESGNREPSFNALLKIADYFGVYTDYLLGNQKYKNTDEELLVVGSKGIVEGKLEAENAETQLELTDILISIIDTNNELTKAGFPSADNFLSEMNTLTRSLYLYCECLSKLKQDCDYGLTDKKEDYESIVENILSLTVRLKNATTEITNGLIDEVSGELLQCLSEYFSVDPPDDDDLTVISKLTNELKGGTGDGNSKKKIQKGRKRSL